MNEQEIFQVAADMPAAERATYLRTACEGQPALRERIERLLVSHDDAAFMQRPAAPSVPAVLEAKLAHRTPEECGERIGKYKLLQQIGEGGCGIVYMAQQEEPVRRSVALKVIKLGMDTKSVIARFQEERQALAMMDHPNIAKVFDAGATGTGRPFFVMELVRGIKLTEYCDQNHLSTTERLGLFVQVCQAIQHAHQKGIIHRDIKPSNILVTLHDGVPVPKVIDFGIAKATTGQRLTDATLFTAFEQFIGTPAYMSPEQASMSGLDIDTRSDIYSLGVLLYELLTGQTPFDGQQLMASGIDAMRKTIREKEPLRPSTRLTQEFVAADVRRLKSSAAGDTISEEEVRASSRRLLRIREHVHLLRGDLDWIVMKCLEKNRSRRYDTANDLAADLKRHLNNEPVIARPPSAAYKLQKAWRRNKLAFTAATAVAIALLVGIGLTTWQKFEANKQRLAAVKESEKARTEQTKAEKAQEAEKESRLRAQYHLYVANVNLARQASEEGNFGRLRKSLDDTKAFPDRGFEWYYWQRQAHLSLKTLRGHSALVRSAVFSPDGQRIVTGSLDQTARVWDAATGGELFKLLGHSGRVFSVAFSPHGQHIVTGGADQTARVWDALTGQELFKLIGHKGNVLSVAFSPDGRRIVTGGADGTVRIWNAAAAGAELLKLEEHANGVNAVAFSPDSQHVISGSHDQTARLWDAANGSLVHKLEARSEVLSVAFSPDGKRIVTGARHGAIFWEAASGKQLGIELFDLGAVSSVAFSKNGQHLLTGTWATTASVWDAANGQKIQTFVGHVGGINSVAFSQDGERIVTAGDDNAKIWDARSGRNSLTLREDISGVLAVAISPDGQRIVTGGTTNRDMIITDTGNQAAQVWATTSGQKLLSLIGHTSGISGVAFSSNGLWIATSSGDQTARVWEAATGRKMNKLEGHKGSVNCIAFSPDSRRIVTGGEDSTARVWETASGKPLLTFPGHTDAINCVAFAPDGQRVVTGGMDDTTRVWEVTSGLELCTLGDPELTQIRSVAFSPDGRRVAAGGYDRVAFVWDVATSNKICRLMGHSGPISSVAFSPDGSRILTGGYDRTVRVWEAEKGHELLMFSDHRRPVTSVAFSRDGQRIVTGSMDQTTKVWDAASAKQVAVWEQEEVDASKAHTASENELAALLRQQADAQKQQRIAHGRDDAGAIKRWLVLAPIALARHERGVQGLDLEQIKGEGGLRPKAGERVVIGSGEFKWQGVAGEDYAIDFSAVLGRETRHTLAYAVCYIRSDVEQHGLRMLLGCNDMAKLYLNGKQIYDAPFSHAFLADHERVEGISLRQGLNVVVFKVLNLWGDWRGSVRLTDAEGNPVRGIRVTVDPDTQAAP